MLKLILALSLFLHTNILLADTGPLSDSDLMAGPVPRPVPSTTVCQGRNGTTNYYIKSDLNPLIDLTNCFKAIYDETAFSSQGVICLTAYYVFLFFPRDGDWSCQRTSTQTKQLTCRGIDSKNRNQSFPLTCR